MSRVTTAIARSHTAPDCEAEMRQLPDRHAITQPGEREVMALVVSRTLSKQVGGELGISEITVKAHRGTPVKDRPGRRRGVQPVDHPAFTETSAGSSG